MSAPSKWPLPENGIRLVTPGFMRKELKKHPLTRECYPTAMGFYPEARHHRMKRERHDDHLLIYCVAGHGRAAAGDWSVEVGPGELLLLPRDLAHDYGADPESPWSIYWVHFAGSAAALFTHYLGFRDDDLPVARLGVSPPAVARFRDMLTAHRTGYSTQAFIHAANQLRQLLTQIALDIRNSEAMGQQSFDLEAVQRFMLEQIGQPLDLGTLAATANLSKYHFATKYKALTGYPPIKHFLNMKMEHACHLLDSSDLNVKGVAAALGYTDPLYFSRLFSRTVGMSPRAYRRSVLK
jgi:AraC-like DNA-binding protein